ncbi:MAG: hypothetical protein EXR79_11425 [Myxococcales bacterium]|nr:hypothetical protein [Myxococcales bacterium]
MQHRDDRADLYVSRALALGLFCAGLLAGCLETAPAGSGGAFVAPGGGPAPASDLAANPDGGTTGTDGFGAAGETAPADALLGDQANALADTGKPPADVATPPADADKPPADVAKPPEDTATPPADIGSFDDQKCQSLLACAQATCPWPAPLECLDKCAGPLPGQANLQGQAKARWESLRACIASKCSLGGCAAGDGKCGVACVAAQCTAQWVACATDDQQGAKSCADIGKCATPACGDKDGYCLAKCVQQGGKAAQTSYSQVLQCVGIDQWTKAKGQTVPTATVQSCFDSAAGCLCPELKPGSGGGACKEFQGCTNVCGTTDVCCLQKCRANLSAQAFTQVNAAIACITKNCSTCKDELCTNTCAASKCTPEVQACQCPGVGAAGSGTSGCGQGVSCAQGCNGSSDPCCIFKCQAALKASSLSKFKALLDCFPKCGCKDGDTSCQTSCALGKCSSEFFACNGD